MNSEFDYKAELERFESGELTDHSTIRKVLDHLRGLRCEECDIASWNGKPLTLLVDYINGLKKDNSPGNLWLICPNCQSQKV